MWHANTGQIITDWEDEGWSAQEVPLEVNHTGLSG